jgi:hypothetical protein
MIRPSLPEYVIDKYSLTEVQRVTGSSPGISYNHGPVFMFFAHFVALWWKFFSKLQRDTEL